MDQYSVSSEDGLTIMVAVPYEPLSTGFSRVHSIHFQTRGPHFCRVYLQHAVYTDRATFKPKQWVGNSRRSARQFCNLVVATRFLEHPVITYVPDCF